MVGKRGDNGVMVSLRCQCWGRVGELKGRSKKGKPWRVSGVRTFTVHPPSPNPSPYPPPSQSWLCQTSGLAGTSEIFPLSLQTSKLRPRKEKVLYRFLRLLPLAAAALSARCGPERPGGHHPSTQAAPPQFQDILREGGPYRPRPLRRLPRLSSGHRSWPARGAREGRTRRGRACRRRRDSPGRRQPCPERDPPRVPEPAPHWPPREAPPQTRARPVPAARSQSPTGRAGDPAPQRTRRGRGRRLRAPGAGAALTRERSPAPRAVRGGGPAWRTDCPGGLTPGEEEAGYAHTLIQFNVFIEHR